MKLSKIILFVLCSLGVLMQSNSLLGQSGEYEKFGLHTANQVTAVFSNWGTISAPGTFADLVWPDSSAVGYAYEIGLYIGGPIIDTSGTEQIIVSEHISDGGDRSSTGAPWGFLPDSTFVNPHADSLPMSDRPATWPDTWSQWPGVHAEGEVLATQESYSRMHDFANAEFAYYPFPDDSSKRGLGVVIESRSFQWETAPYDDCIIWEYHITNASDKTLPELRTGFYGDPHIGGKNDYPDDNTGFVSSDGVDYPDSMAVSVQNLLYSWDADMSGDGGMQPGYFGLGLLSNSSNLTWEFAHVTRYGNRVQPGQDHAFWDLVTSPTSLMQTTDNIIYLTTNAFALAPHESKTLAMTTVFGATKSELFANFQAAQNVYAAQVVSVHQETANPYQTVLASNYPNPFNPSTTITYQLETSGPVTLRIYNLQGQIIRELVNEVQPEGMYSTVWHGRNRFGAPVASGIYWYALQTADVRQVRKMVLVR